jgi:hypothetical protein
MPTSTFWWLGVGIFGDECHVLWPKGAYKLQLFFTVHKLTTWRIATSIINKDGNVGRLTLHIFISELEQCKLISKPHEINSGIS